MSILPNAVHAKDVTYIIFELTFFQLSTAMLSCYHRHHLNYPTTSDHSN